FCRATGSDSVNGFQSYGPIDKAIADAFARGTGPGPENRTKFSLYFGDEWRKAKWNRIVIQNISSSIIDQKEQAHISGDLSKDIIEAYVWDLSTQARNSWRAKKPRPLETGKRWETGAEALARAKDYEARREKDLRSNSRKRNKFEERQDGVAKLIKASQSTVETRNWQMTQNVLLECGVEGQSSDDTDPLADFEADSPVALYTSVPHYRRRVLSEVFGDLDSKIRALKTRTARDIGKRLIRRPTRLRIRGQLKTERTVVRKLPESCYHRRYIQSLDPVALDELGMKRTEIHLFDKWANTQADSDSDSNSMEED
ncbi:MAG: hypothetical protein NXY57DRAFT_891824, partial [Lentinula lateritia]